MARRRARGHLDASRRGRRRAVFVDAQRCYERWGPTTPPDVRLVPAGDVPYQELDAGGRFGGTSFRRYEYDVSYTTAEYRDLLLSYSGHRALPETARQGLPACIVRLIDERYGGRIAKRCMNQLAVAHLGGER